MTAEIVIMFVIVFILVLSIINDVWSILLYDLLLIYVGSTMSTSFNLPTGSEPMFYVIMGLMILISLYKTTHIVKKARLKAKRIKEGDMMTETV